MNVDEQSSRKKIYEKEKHTKKKYCDYMRTPSLLPSNCNRCAIVLQLLLFLFERQRKCFQMLLASFCNCNPYTHTRKNSRNERHWICWCFLAYSFHSAFILSFETLLVFLCPLFLSLCFSRTLALPLSLSFALPLSHSLTLTVSFSSASASVFLLLYFLSVFGFTLIQMLDICLKMRAYDARK